MKDIISALLFLPVVVVWVLALWDVLTRKDYSHKRRIATGLALALVFPLTLLYLLARPPSAVRRGPETTGDPRTAVVARLESAEPSDRDPEWSEWVRDAVAAGRLRNPPEGTQH